MNKIFSMVIGVTLLSAQVASAQVTESDLMATGMPALQAETVYDLATQGTVADDLAIGGDAITFAAAGTISSTGSGNDITINPVDAFIVRAAQDANRLLTFSAASDTALILKVGDGTAAQDITLSSGAADASDNSRICLAGGGACNGSGTRGGFIRIAGNEYSGAGDVELYAGDASGSNMTVGTIHASGVVNLYAGASLATVQLTQASSTTPTMLFGAAATADQTFLISSASADAADTDIITIAGGGAAIASRGAYLRLNGNEATGAADVILTGGSAAGSNTTIATEAADGVVTVQSGAGVQAVVFQADQDAVFASEITSSETGSLGWSMVSGANTACTTTCTGAAVFGFDAGTSLPVGPTDATADHCICASAS